MYPYTDATYHDPQFSYVMDSSFPNFTDSLKTAWNFTKKGVKGLHDGFIQKVLQRGDQVYRFLHSTECFCVSFENQFLKQNSAPIYPLTAQILHEQINLKKTISDTRRLITRLKKKLEDYRKKLHGYQPKFESCPNEINTILLLDDFKEIETIFGTENNEEAGQKFMNLEVEERLEILEQIKENIEKMIKIKNFCKTTKEHSAVLQKLRNLQMDIDSIDSREEVVLSAKTNEKSPSISTKQDGHYPNRENVDPLVLSHENNLHYGHGHTNLYHANMLHPQPHPNSPYLYVPQPHPTPYHHPNMHVGQIKDVEVVQAQKS